MNLYSFARRDGHSVIIAVNAHVEDGELAAGLLFVERQGREEVHQLQSESGNTFEVELDADKLNLRLPHYFVNERVRIRGESQEN